MTGLSYQMLFLRSMLFADDGQSLGSMAFIIDGDPKVNKKPRLVAGLLCLSFGIEIRRR